MSSSPSSQTPKRSVGERLAALSGAKQPTAPPRVPRPGAAALECLIEGRWIHSPLARVYQTTVRFPLHHRHGSAPLGDWLASTYEGLSVIAAESQAAHLDPRKTLFLDTETTGLAGGMGTVAFMIGLAWLQGDALSVEQLFIEDFPHEPFLLKQLAERLRAFRFLVTFNGKAYDRDILEARLALHKVASPFGALVHLDLLHAARRIWRECLADCRLATLEEALLGVRRVRDIPGAEIPQAYFDFLLHGETARLASIFEHNRMDLLSLVALAARLNALYHTRAEPHEKSSIARLHLRRREIEKALAWFESSLQAPVPDGVRVSTRKMYAQCLKSAGRPLEAAAVWEELVREQRVFDSLPFEELAKHYEHRTGDFARALAVTEEALAALARQRAFAAHVDPSARERLSARKSRLLAKATRRNAGVFHKR